MTSGFWDRAARVDPMWAVLSDPAKRGRRWRAAEFFATGRREISLLLFELSRLGHPPRTDAALDFGCGLGRLSQALGATFSRVVGIDVSPTMIDLATRLNQFPSRVSYLLNDRPDLTRIESGSIDLVYSDIVLQHIPPDESRGYLAEFIRVLRPGGIAVFQLPSTIRPPTERPTAPVAMPEGAYRASLVVGSDRLERLEPGATRDCLVEITNSSGVDWDQAASGALRVGNHWLAADGSMLIQDDGRASLPERLAAGAHTALVLPVTAPPGPGRYQCEVDLVHEGITWFSDRGSRTARIPVVVSGDATPATTNNEPAEEHTYPSIEEFLPPFDPDAEFGEFPMHGIPAPQVLELIRAHGAECFHMDPDERGGPEWIGFRYFVRRRG